MVKFRKPCGRVLVNIFLNVRFEFPISLYTFGYIGVGERGRMPFIMECRSMTANGAVGRRRDHSKIAFSDRVASLATKRCKKFAKIVKCGASKSAVQAGLRGPARGIRAWLQSDRVGERTD